MNAMTTATAPQTASVLNRLISVCKDSENAFKAASQELMNAELAALCLQYSQQRGRFALELQEEVSRLGEKPVAEGSVTGAVKRNWMTVKATFSGQTEDIIIDQCEQGEDDIKAAYETAMKEYMPATLTSVLQRQYEKIKEGHDRFSAMKKAIS